MSRAAGVRIPVGARYFLSTKTVKNVSVAHPASYSVGTEFISEGRSGQEIKLTFDIHVAPRLRMRGGLNLLSLYTFMAGTRPTLPSTFLTPPTRGPLRPDSSRKSDDRNTKKGHINRKQLPQSS
jgi:hypothetical protein